MASEFSRRRTPEKLSLAPLRQHAPAAAVGMLALLALAVGSYLVLAARAHEQAQERMLPTVVTVQVQPETPTPPPPPNIPAPKVTMMIPAPNAQALPPQLAQPRPAAPAPSSVGTSIPSNGQSTGFDLSGTPGGMGWLSGAVGGGVGGNSAWAYYDSLLQTQIGQALEKNQHTSHAMFQVVARIWIDGSGTVTRAAVSTTGDSTVDNALQNEVLTGAHYSAAPPAGMPMPVVVKITGQSP